jgi:uncharacterized protein with FMN-binding domain
MKDFTLRLIALIIVITTIAGYDVVLAMREKDDQIARLTAQVESQEAQIEALGSQTGEGSTDGQESSRTQAGASAGQYRDGTYTGASQGYGGDITVEVTIEGGAIADIRIVSAPGEDAAYLDSAKALIPQMLEAQTSELDAVSGATLSSVGLLNAVSIALNDAL